MNSQFTFDNSLGDEILTVEAQCNGLHLEHKVEELDSPGHKGSFDNYFLENDLQQDTSDFWDNPSSDKVITELQPEEVRWFYKSYSNKRWIEFCGCDSLNIEAKYQQHFNGDWKFYISKTKANTELSNGDSPDSPDSEREKYSVVVRGGLYEVELLEKQCVSIYWPGMFWGSLHRLCKQIIIILSPHNTLFEQGHLSLYRASFWLDGSGILCDDYLLVKI